WATRRAWPSPLRSLEGFLHVGEAAPQAPPTGRDPAVLDHGGDPVDLDLGLDALERGGCPCDREADGILDGVGRRSRELDRLLDHGSSSPGLGVGLDRRTEAREPRVMGGVTLGLGFGVGLVVGVLVGWLVAGLRARERAGEAREARARLETELEGERRLAAERVSMLEDGEERLREAFEALSRRA